VWCQPDHGIWEVRTSGRPLTYSATLCQVALEREVRGEDTACAGQPTTHELPHGELDADGERAPQKLTLYTYLIEFIDGGYKVCGACTVGSVRF
jgi:hypothetical protein